MKKMTILLPFFWLLLCVTTALLGQDAGPSNPIAIKNRLETPQRNVKMTNGTLKTVFDNNLKFLTDKFPLDDLLYVFRERAGMANPPGRPFSWDKGGPQVTGSVMGIFLMGAGNALRWEEHPVLKERMNKAIDGLEDCRQPNGFLMGYREQDTPVRENANYVRSWITHGLIDAALAGNPKALTLIRGQLDCFNHSEYLSKVVDRERGYIPDHWIPYQGMISSTRMYLSPLGRRDDLDLILNHYQEDWWLEQLIANDDRAIYNRPESHCYEITAFEAYLDLYRITGDMKYLRAVLNAWEMLRDKWQMPGGSWALCERKRYPPKSYLMGSESRSGELCCAVFWIKLNQRLHLLFPDVEAYVGEIEKSIYNAGIGNQLGGNAISYHTILHGQKERPIEPPEGTCCEGQGVRLFGSLPEYLYSFSPEGIYVDLYAPSEISWKHQEATITLVDKTAFPYDGNVELNLHCSQSASFRMSLRIPSYAANPVEIFVNGKPAGAGIPGHYLHLDRSWRDGDSVRFQISMELKIHRYEGYDQIPGYDRYWLERGPALLALQGKFNLPGGIRILNDAGSPASWLMPVPDRPLHYRIAIEKGYWGLREDEAWSEKFFEYLPYWEIPLDQPFTVFPVIQGK